MPRRTRKKGSKQQRKRVIPKIVRRRGSIFDNPVVGGMTEKQAERLLAEIRGSTQEN
jgi:hypothetical protein